MMQNIKKTVPALQHQDGKMETGPTYQSGPHSCIQFTTTPVTKQEGGGSLTDPFAYLVNAGWPVERLQYHISNGLTVAQVAQSVESMIARGATMEEIIAEELHGQLSEPKIDTFAPFEPFEPPDIAKLPPFPVDCLPPVPRYMARAAADSLQVAVDMTAVSVLAVASLCVQGKFVISPKPGWVESLNLYAAVVAKPSDRKTPALDCMTKPLHIFERMENERRAPLVEVYKMKRDILTKQIAHKKELAAKGKTIDFDEITELQYQLADLDREQVKPLRLLADDTTPEALVSLMAANDGKMGIFSDEGGFFSIVAGRYSGKANLDALLKAYSGSYMRVDRQGRANELIDHPALTMLLMLQPSVLENVVGNGEFSGRGLLARILFSIPVSTVGHRTYNTPPMPEGLEDTYSTLLCGLLSIPDTGEPRTIKVTPEAHAEAEKFFESLEPRLVDDLGGGDIESWAGKLHGQVMRIAGIIHCCLYSGEAAQNPVSLETMKAAETIGLYFVEHAKAAFKIAGLSEGKNVQDARFILRRLGNQTETTKRDLFHLCKSRFEKVDAMEPGLKVLIQRGYIAMESIKTKGRPSEKIYVNPLYQKNQKPQKLN